MVAFGRESSVATEPRLAELPASVGEGAAAIADRLRQAILEGTYAFGARLPAEREMARHFGTSRSTIRQALRQLEEQHLLTRRIGSGTFVSHRVAPDGDYIAEVTSPLELIDVRLAIEPNIARLAAVNATARDLDRVGQALAAVEAAGDDREAFTAADEQFHLLLAECTRNPLMAWLYRQINDVRGHRQWTAMKIATLDPAEVAAYNEQHRMLFEALQARDREAAVATITRHLEKAKNALIGAHAES